MTAQLHDAQTQLRHDRRFAEITASFNGINLRQRFPDLDRDQRAELVRMARRLLRDEERAAEVDAEPMATAVASRTDDRPASASGSTIVRPRQPEARHAARQEPDLGDPTDEEPALGRRVAAAPALAVDEPAWTELMQGGRRRRRNGLRASLWTVAVLFVMAAAGWHQRDQLMALWSSATGMASEPPTARLAPGSAPAEDRADVQAIIERHRDMLGSEPDGEALEAAKPAPTPLAAAADSAAAAAATGSSGEPATGSQTAASEAVEDGGADEAGPTPATHLADAAPARTEATSAKPEAIAEAVAKPESPPPAASKATPPPPAASKATPPPPAATTSPPPQQASVATASPRPAAGAPPYDPLTETSLVRQIQTRLRALGFDTGPVDGVMGWQTYKAIRAFQQSKGVPVDGQPTELLLGVLVTHGSAGSGSP